MSVSFLGTDIAKELEDLETTLLPQFLLTIQAAQRNPSDDMAKWLTRLKNAYYGAEAILHDLEYEHLKQVAEEEDKNSFARLSGKSIFEPLTEKFPLLSSQKRRLHKKLKELKKVAEEAKTFRDLLYVLGIQNIESMHNVGNNRSITSSGCTDKVFGRDIDREEIIKFLFDEQGGSSSNKSYSVFTIAGMGGAGKTTLAQHVYNDKRVEKHFGKRMWLCLSENLDIIEHTTQMIESSSGTRPNLCNLDALQKKLLETIPESDNILVVLDNVWYDNNDRATKMNEQWERLLQPFAYRKRTCKIVVTSRSSCSFPNALQSEKCIELRDLAHDDFISLVKYHAFKGLQIINPQLSDTVDQIAENPQLSDTVDQIAKKMSKLPLAAKVVGNELGKMPDIRFWQDTLSNVNLSNILGDFAMELSPPRCAIKKVFLIL